MAIEALEKQSKLERVIERLEREARRAERNSEKAEALGEAYERHYVFFDAKASAYRKAIEIIKEELM